MVQATRCCSLVVCFIRDTFVACVIGFFFSEHGPSGDGIGQGVPGSMTVKKGLFANGAKVVVDGVTMRPGRAARR